MPKFHLETLPIININNDYHIELDNKTYNEQEQYSKVSTIFFSNKYGSVKIKGIFDLSNKNIPSLIIINKLYLEISNQLLNACIYNFGTYQVELEFNFSFKDINNIKGIEQYLTNEYNCKIDYDNRKIYILLNEINNIDIIHKLEGELEKEDNENFNNYINMMKTRQKIKNFDEMLQFPKVSTIKSNIINDENIQNEIIEEDNDNYNDNDSLNNIEMKDISYIENPFINANISDKIEEKKIETLSDFNLNMGLGNKINYVKNKDINDISDINNLAYKEGKENYLNKIKNSKIKNAVNKLISNGALLMKKNIKTNILNTISINGSYLLLNNNNDKYGNNYKFSPHSILLNNDISGNSDDLNDYKNIIFENYIALLDNMIINNNNNLNINDYTHLIMIYINQIQNKIDEIYKKQNKTLINNKLVEKYKKIISALKLFCILFLNCFMYKPENEYINNPNLFTDSFSDKVMLYRKRLLIEWCVDEQKNQIEKKSPNINIINADKENDIKANYEKLYSFGQIKKNIDNDKNKKISLFMRAKMSNNIEKISKNNMYYFTGYNSLHGENNRQFRDIFIDKYNNDWLSFFIQSLLYEEKRDNYIVYSIELLTKNINKMSDKAKPIINNNNNNNIVHDINFVLLKLYESYIKGDINEQIKYLKMLSYSCNINKNNSSDHFIQYIICSILLKIIPIIFPKDDQLNREITDKIFIKKMTYNLLLKIIEELLINAPIDTYGNYIHAIKLILLSFLSNKIKNKLINYLISKINITSESLNNIEENNPLLLNENQKYNLLGYIYNSLCLWKNAYNCFISSKEYKYALDACINYAIAEIKNNNENTDFKEIFLRLNSIKKNKPNLFVDIYQSFYLFFKYMCENKKNNIEINNINILLKEFSSKEKYLCCDLIDDDTRGIIIDLLYKLLIKLNEEKYATGNSELIVNKYIKTKTELNMMNNALLDNIKYKNNIFC